MTYRLLGQVDPVTVPPSPVNWPTIFGWAAVVGVAVAIFNGTINLRGSRTRANRRQKTRRNSRAHITEMHEGQAGWKMPREAMSDDGAPAELMPGMVVTRTSDGSKWSVLEDIGPVPGDRWGRRRFVVGSVSGSKKVSRNSHRGSGSTYRDVRSLKVGALVGARAYPRFDITLEERTDSSTSHARYHVSVFDRRANHSWGMDFSKLSLAEDYMDDQALALSKVGDDWNPRKRVTANGYRGAGFKRPPRVGTRVVFDPNPASRALYSGQHPALGERGTVSTVAGPGGKMSFMHGPGGGLVYVDWDESRFQGVSLNDLSKA